MLKRLLAAIEQAKREGRPLARIQMRNSDLDELESELVGGGATFVAGAAVALPDGARLKIAGVPIFSGPSSKGRPWCEYADGDGFVAPEIGTVRAAGATVVVGNGFLPDNSPRSRQAAAERIIGAAGIKPIPTVAHTSISIVGDRIRIELDGNEQDPARRARNERVLAELVGAGR